MIGLTDRVRRSVPGVLATHRGPERKRCVSHRDYGDYYRDGDGQCLNVDGRISAFGDLTVTGTWTPVDLRTVVHGGDL